MPWRSHSCGQQQPWLRLGLVGFEERGRRPVSVPRRLQLAKQPINEFGPRDRGAYLFSCVGTVGKVLTLIIDRKPGGPVAVQNLRAIVGERPTPARAATDQFVSLLEVQAGF